MHTSLSTDSRGGVALPAPAPLPGRLLHEGAWVALGQALSALGLLAGLRLLTEVVPPAVFGTASLLLGVTALASQLACAPLLNALVRFHPDRATRGGAALVGRTVGRGIARAAAAVAALILAGGAAASALGGPSFPVFPIVAALFLAESARSFQTTLLTAARRQRAYAFWTAADAVARPSLAVLAVVLLGETPAAVLGGYLAGSGAVAIACRLARRAGSGPEAPPAPDPGLARELRRYALPFLPLAVIGWLGMTADRYVIAGAWGVGIAGLYAAGAGLVSRPFGIAWTTILTTLRPAYFESVSSGDRPAERSTRRALLGLTAAVSAAGFILVLVLREPLTAWLLNERYRSIAPLLPWIALGCGLQGLAFAFNTVSLAHKRPSNVLLSELGGAAAALAAGVPLTLRYGLAGAAWAVPVHTLVQLAIAWALSRRAGTAPVPEARP